VPALFRIIDAAGDKAPSLLLDEADRLFGSSRKDEDNRDLIALLNSGFRRGNPTYRCVGPQQTPTAFSNYAMAAVAGIGRQPDTIEDRAVCIVMRRRAPGETVAKLRLRTDLDALHELREKVSAWAERSRDELARIPSDIPDLEDRAQDAWEPLLAVADAAGGDWPQRARNAARVLSASSAEDDTDASPALRLLADVRDIFGAWTVFFMASNELLANLRKIEDGPWRDEDLTARALADRLREYGIKPCRNSQGTVRGYKREDFADAFARYLPALPSETVRTVKPQPDQRERADGSKSSDASNRQTESNCRPLTSKFDALTVSDASPHECDHRYGGDPPTCRRCGKGAPVLASVSA